MRNLKKILALVLALMMVLSVMVFASAANYDDYSDKDQVSPEYAEAVEVLTGMDIFWGSENSFYPKSNVTRAEVATLLYRIMTGDITGSQVGIYKDYGMFDDVSEDNWFAGYVNYAANGELVVGVGDNKYNPKGNVTGYEWITMLLRAIGYDANGEISGSTWKITAASQAKESGILGSFNEATLNSALTREQVAYLLFNAIQARKVNYTNAFGYRPSSLGYTIAWDMFRLAKTGTISIDAWGRPGYVWYGESSSTATPNTANYNSTVDTKYAAIEEAYTVHYTTAVTECDVADDTTDRDTNYALYVNGQSLGNYTVNATDVVTRIGARGRLTEVYKDRIVMVDTFLAQVTDVKAATYDKNNHLFTPATITLSVYDAATNNDPAVGTPYTLTNGATNWTYTVGQYVLLNAYTQGTNSATASGKVNNTTTGKYGEITGVANALVGSQTRIWHNAEQHTVNGTDYYDAMKFYLDQAGTETAAHTWYFDDYNNLIGVTNISTQYTYGVISSLWWSGNVNTGTGTAQATLTYMDGSSAQVTLSLIDDDGLNSGNLGYVPVAGYDGSAMGARVFPTTTATGQIAVAGNAYINATSANNAGHGIIGGHMFQFETLADGTVAAYKVMNEISGAEVEGGVSAITNGTTTFYTNSNTVYLVKNADGTYTSVTGYNNIYDYTTYKAKVDYVMANSVYAQYVYIIGTPDNAQTSAFVMSTGMQWSEVLRTDANGVQYYTFTYGLDMDGSTNTMNVLASARANVITKMVNSVGKLFKIDYVNGYATNATEVAVAPAAATTAGSYSAVYLGTDVTATAEALYNADGVLDDVDNNTHYNVTNSTVVIGGTLADLATAGKGVYIVYATGNENDVTHIYITSFAKNTVADALAALTNTNYGTLTVYGVTAGTNLNANVLNLVNARLAAAGVTGVTASINPTWNVTAPAIGATSGTQYFQIELTDVFGGSDSVGSNAIVVTNSNTTSNLNDTIKSHLEAMTSVVANMTKSEVEGKVTTRIGQVAATTDLTITVVLPTTMQAGEIVNVIVVGTVGGVAVNTSAQVVVQA